MGLHVTNTVISVIAKTMHPELNVKHWETCFIHIYGIENNKKIYIQSWTWNIKFVNLLPFNSGALFDISTNGGKEKAGEILVVI